MDCNEFQDTIKHKACSSFLATVREKMSAEPSHSRLNPTQFENVNVFTSGIKANQYRKSIQRCSSNKVIPNSSPYQRHLSTIFLLRDPLDT